jgi:hypothetical protein
MISLANGAYFCYACLGWVKHPVTSQVVPVDSLGRPLDQRLFRYHLPFPLL